MSTSRVIVSLFDYSGVWCQPYRDAGYEVHQYDLKLGQDILKLNRDDFPTRVRGILAAPPCTHFSGSGARWWREKDEDGRTDKDLELIDKVLDIVRWTIPTWWALENPVGRLSKLRPQLGQPLLRFNPCDYGDPWTKRTCLWGDFNPKLHRSPVEPELYETSTGKRGSWYWAKLGGKSERTKELRSMTPPGFAKAFFEANP